MVILLIENKRFRETYSINFEYVFIMFILTYFKGIRWLIRLSTDKVKWIGSALILSDPVKPQR